MRSATETESHYHSFIGECAALRWAIAKNKIYLCGTRFYAMCDIKTLNKILEYDGPIHSLRRWTQELLAYDFETIHRPATMMRDVDTLNRGPYCPNIAHYSKLTAALAQFDRHYNSKAYDADVFESLLS